MDLQTSCKGRKSRKSRAIRGYDHMGNPDTMKRTLKFLAVLLLTPPALLPAADLPKANKPNILFIMTDQQSYNMMSCMSNQWLHTPNMDKLASTGYRFEKTYCVNPVCQPSRFSLFTGHYASEVGVKNNSSFYNKLKVKEIVSASGLGNIFRQAGYETLYSGKTHLYGRAKDASEYGFKQESLDPYDGPAIYAEKVLAQFGKENRANPFFMVLSFMNPHDICYKAGADHRFPNELPADNARETARLLAVKKALTPEEYRRQIPPRRTNAAAINGEQLDMLLSEDVSSRSWGDDQWNLYDWMYLRLTESVDAQIGRVLLALEKSGLADNTIIVFTSDHGDMEGAHGLTLKSVMFEECQRVPFIFAGKGIQRGCADKSTLVCNGLDLLPTLCDLCGIAPPSGLPGISLKPYLTGSGQKPGRQYIFPESCNAYQVADGRYKYTIYELPGHPELLTDLKENPGETINYAANPAYGEIKATLQKALLTNLSKRLVFRMNIENGLAQQELFADLSKRGLAALPEDRTPEQVKKIGRN